MKHAPLPLFFHSACPITVPSASRTFSNSYITKTLAVLSGHQHCCLLIWMSYYNAQSLCVFISKLNGIISRVSQWNGNVIGRKKVLAANGKEIYSDGKNREQLHKTEVYAVRFQQPYGFSYFPAFQ